MAAVTGSSTFLASISYFPKQNKVLNGFSGVNSVSLSVNEKIFPTLNLRPSQRRFHFSLAAKPETVEKVCELVKRQLALPDDTEVTGESKFVALGVDSLDLVEIMMELEEEFGISVEEENAQSIATVEEAADMIEKLLESKDDPNLIEKFIESNSASKDD